MLRAAALLLPLAVLAACQTAKKEEEPSKDTFVCALGGERLVVRFTEGEARLLFVGGDRTILYQVGTTDGSVRFSNGVTELRGRGTSLTLIRDGNASTLAGCEPLMVPK
jgi:hypothetical protein